MFIVLEKLSNDKHIEYREAFKRYRITFEGLVFNGYERTAIIADQNEKRIIRNEIWLLRGTWAAAIIGFLVLFGYIFLCISLIILITHTIGFGKQSPQKNLNFPRGLIYSLLSKQK